MKRFALLLVCATLFVCLLAASGAEAKRGVMARTYRPPVDSTIMWGPVWFEYSGDTGTYSDVTWHQADPGDSWIYKSVPIDDDIYLFSMWGGVNFGYIWNVPRYLPHTVDITGPGDYEKHFDPTETAGFWKGPFFRDQFWVDWWFDTFGYDLEAFNPRIGTGFFFTTLMLPVGPFPEEGLYSVHVAWTSTRPLNEMVYVGVDPARPTHTAPGVQAYEYTFSMYVE